MPRHGSSKPSRRVAVGLIGLVVLAAAATAAHAASADPRPVTLVVPFSAGGPSDRLARDLAEALRRPLGQPIAIENVAGAGGTLGATRVARSAADGQTLLLAHIGIATAPALYRGLQFRTLEDFAFLGMVAEVPMTLIGRPTLPARDLPELLDWMQANKGRINLANAGQGAASHVCGLLLQQRIGVAMKTVSYKGTAPALSDLLAGHVDLLCDQTTNTSAPISAGRVRAFGVTTRKRLETSALASLPTLDEAGLRGFDVSVWHGLYAPAGTPEALRQRINAALKRALRDPEFVRRQQALGAVVITDARTEPAGHRRFVETEMVRWAAVIRAAAPHTE